MKTLGVGTQSRVVGGHRCPNVSCLKPGCDPKRTVSNLDPALSVKPVGK